MMNDIYYSINEHDGRRKWGKTKRDVEGEVNGETLQVENEEKDPEADTERPSSRFVDFG